MEAISKDYGSGPIGVCFHAMSVTEDPWTLYADGEEEAHDYDLRRDTGHLFVFETLAAQKEQEEQEAL